MAANAELEELAITWEHFTRKLFQLAEKIGLFGCDYEMDHLAVRCNSITTAKRWHEGLLECGKLISAKPINGRVIALFQLQKPIQVMKESVHYIELPYPGKKTYSHEGWEHLEVVLRSEPTKFTELLENEGFFQRSRNSGVSYHYSEPKGENERLSNPTWVFSERGISIKIHPYFLHEVITSENQ